MENENMVYEVEVMDLVPAEAETQSANAGLSTGMAMLIGGLVTTVGIYGFKKVKGLIAKRKAKKAEAECDACEDEE